MAIEQELANAAFYRDNYAIDEGMPASDSTMRYRAAVAKANLTAQASEAWNQVVNQSFYDQIEGRITPAERDAILEQAKQARDQARAQADQLEAAVLARDPAAVQLAGQLWYEREAVPTIESAYAGGQAPAQPIIASPEPPPSAAPVATAPTTPVTAPTTPVATPVATPVVTPGATTGAAPGTTPGFTPSPLAASTSNFLSNIPQLVQAPTVSPLLQNLPALRGGAAGESSIDPTLRPYLETGLQAAEQLYLRQTPQLYPGQMYVSPSAQTLDALTQQEQIARAQPSALQAAQESYMQGLGGLSATAQGAFLMGNPYLQAAIQSATRPIEQQFAETTLPGIASQYSRAGRYGSGAMARSLGQATEATGRALGDVSANIAYQGYEAERGRQQQAMGGQISAAQMAPNIYGQQFLPSQQLAQVGAAQETLAAQPLQEAMQRYQYSQQIPYQQLQGFLSSVYGTPMAGSQYAPAAQPNTAGNVLGGLAAGAGVGNLFRQAGVESIFGMNPVTAGSIFGTAAGLLF